MKSHLLIRVEKDEVTLS